MFFDFIVNCYLYKKYIDITGLAYIRSSKKSKHFKLVKVRFVWFIIITNR